MNCSITFFECLRRLSFKTLMKQRKYIFFQVRHKEANHSQVVCKNDLQGDGKAGS